MSFRRLIKLSAVKNKKGSDDDTIGGRVASEIARASIGAATTHAIKTKANEIARDKLMRPVDAKEVADYDKVVESLKARSGPGSFDARGVFGDVSNFEDIKNKQGGSKHISIIRQSNVLGGGGGAALNLGKTKFESPEMRGHFSSSGLDPDTVVKNLKSGGRHHQVLIEHQNPNILLHELGHIAGDGRNDTLKHKLINLNKKGYGLGQKPAAQVAAALAPSVVNMATKRRDNETREEFLDRQQKYRNRISALTVLPSVPTLVEEARASINAHNIGKKIGVKVSKKDLLAAYGTYLAGGLAPSALRNISDRVVNKYEKDRARHIEAHGKDYDDYHK